ncbi:MAG: cytochrome b/b6 domain-containing protein [Chloroflexi bacterium]|nr:cytochrome b/b6 domain-containing protein [Chloroflexota bacterium]
MAVTAKVQSRAAPQEQEENVVRFDIHQRLQHILMMSSFIVLAATGLPLKFSESGISQWWISFWGGIESTRFAHRIAAFVMVGDCVYHVLYLAYTTAILKRPFPFQMLPSPQDVQNLYQDLRYYLGLSRTQAQYGRFNYREKFDYWAIFWGMPIMAGSGFILMYPVLVSEFLPNWAIPVALVAHSDEAVLAVSWIFIVHIFFAHLAPGVFPMNKSIFTGKVPRHRYMEEHPLELAQTSAPAKEPEMPEQVPRPALPQATDPNVVPTDAKGQSAL